NIVFHPELTDFFNPEYKIFNERTLICQNATLKPDKVVLKPNHQALLLDYKTGKKEEKYKLQLQNYANVLHDMGFVVTQKTLVYIGKEIELMNEIGRASCRERVYISVDGGSLRNMKKE